MRTTRPGARSGEPISEAVVSGYICFSVDSDGNPYAAETYGGRTQKFKPKPGADSALPACGSLVTTERPRIIWSGSSRMSRQRRPSQDCARDGTMCSIEESPSSEESEGICIDKS